jgi:hypothetical protein
VAADLDVVPEQDRDLFPVKLVQPRIRVDIDFLEIDAEGAQRLRHLLAQVAVGPAVQLNPYR